jgi:hypothetical protein
MRFQGKGSGRNQIKSKKIIDIMKQLTSIQPRQSKIILASPPETCYTLSVTTNNHKYRSETNMPRLSLDLSAPNVEQLEFTADQINKWVDFQDLAVMEKLEQALDEAQADIANGSTKVQYVIIKIT